MKNLLLLACAALPLLACAGAVDDSEQTSSQSDGVTLAPGLIDFDEVNGTPIPNDSIIDTTYTSYGVTFGCVVCSSGHAYARAFGTGSQGVSLLDPQVSGTSPFDARDGAVTATFEVPRSWVSIDAAPVLSPEHAGRVTNAPFIEAFDANGNYLSQMLYSIAYGQTGYGNVQTITVTSSTANIKTVYLSSQHASGPSVYATFDNLRYSGDVLVVRPIPLPPGYPLHPILGQ